MSNINKGIRNFLLWLNWMYPSSSLLSEYISLNLFQETLLYSELFLLPTQQKTTNWGLHDKEYCQILCWNFTDFERPFSFVDTVIDSSFLQI